MRVLRPFSILMAFGLGAIGLSACTPSEPDFTRVSRSESSLVPGMLYDFYRYSSPFSYRGFDATHKFVLSFTDVFGMMDIDPDEIQEELEEEFERIVEKRSCPDGSDFIPGPEYREARSTLSFTYLYTCF